MASRRDFLRWLPLGAAAAAGPRPTGLWAEVRAGTALTHPEPRNGIDGSGVLTSADLPDHPPETHAIYDMIREIPQIADGIGCACGCAALPGYRSLLTCYSEGGMAMGCYICQGEAKLAYRRFNEGQTLEQIRRAIDGRYG